MADLLAWDPRIAPRDISFNLRGQTVRGPATLTGQSQVAAIDAGYWEAFLSRIDAAGPTNVLAYRSMRAKMGGGANHALVPCFDPDQAPWPVAGGPAANRIIVPWSGPTYFTGGVGFGELAIKVALASALAVGSTVIDVTVTTAGTIYPGMRFSIVDRLYEIVEKITSTKWRIGPAARAVAAVGTSLNFDRPVCRMQLADEMSGDLSLQYGRIGAPDMRFVEAP